MQIVPMATTVVVRIREHKSNDPRVATTIGRNLGRSRTQASSATSPTAARSRNDTPYRQSVRLRRRFAAVLCDAC
jgi:hypothetical protein